MTIVDLGVIVLILLGAILGAKRGFLKETLCATGFILCIVFAFLLKNPVASFLYDHLPFFSFGGLIKGITTLNILVYEVLAFFITLSVLTIIIKIIRYATGVFEKLLDATSLLGVPSKILGGIVGAIEWLVISFVVLFAISLPIFNNKFVYKSIIYDELISLAPHFSTQIDATLKVFNEFTELKDKYKNTNDVNQFNLDSLDLFLKYHIIDVESADKLYKKGKFKTIKNIEEVLDKYREDE